MASRKDQHATTPDTHPGQSTRGLADRATDWIATHRVQAALLGGLTLLMLPLLIGLPVVYLSRATPRTEVPAEPVEPPTLAAALAALDAGEWNRAFHLAEALALSGELPIEEQGGPPLVMGAVALKRVEGLQGDDRQRQLALASSYLERAHGLGFPEEREAEGILLLGHVLAERGRPREAKPLLDAALPLNAARAVEIHRWLADVCLSLPDPPLEEALDHNSQWQADPKLSPVDRQRAVLQRARIELALSHFAACRQALDGIPANSPLHDEALLLGGRLLLAEARALRETPGDRPSAEVDASIATRSRQARDTFREVQARHTTGSPLAADCSYLIGLAYAELGDDRAALGQWERTRDRHADSPATLAAGLEYADLLRRLGRDADSMKAYRQTLARVKSWETFSNPWLSAEGVRNRLLASYQGWLKQEKFAIAIDFTRLISRVLERGRAVQLAAQTEREWGRALLAQAAVASAAESGPLTDAGRAQLRAAGATGLELAELRFATREYPDDLWNAATDFHAGHDYTDTVRVLKQYLDLELPRRRPQALVLLGESLLSLDQPVNALAVLRECIETYPHDPASYGARLLASQAWAERGSSDEAAKLLLENLEGDFLTPASQEWRDSLFALGRLMFQTGHYQEAVARLDEAVARYADDRRAAEAQYLSADAYRELAYETNAQIAAEATLQGRLARGRDRERQLQDSLARYERAMEALFRQQEHTALLPLDQALLRNCYFGRGSVLFELARFPEALKAYSSAANRYQQSPEVLEAYVQIAECYRRLDQPVEARGTLEQAKVILNRMPSQVAFDVTTNYTRDQWQRLLEAMSKL